MFKDKNINFFAKLAIVIAIITISLKSIAYFITGSVGLLSDALESLLNLATAIITLVALNFAKEPEDQMHQFGHYKIEYFSSMIEGFFICFAGISIILTGLERLFHPIEINSIDIGIIISIIASLANFFAAYHMFNAAKKYNSIALKSDAHHLMTDIYTSVGVLLGVIIAYFSEILIIDAIVAILVGFNILFTSIHLFKISFHGLMDSSIEKNKENLLSNLIQTFLEKKIQIDFQFDLKTRLSGQVIFIYLNIGIPDNLNIKESHDITKELTKHLKENFKEYSKLNIFIHLEPNSDFLHENI